MNFRRLLPAAALLLPAVCLAAVKVPGGAALASLTLPDGFVVTAELALTQEQQARGLMFRASLPPDRGMLFAFSDGGFKSFWMKNTLIDLDMVFLDADLRVAKVFHRVPRSYEGQPESEVARAGAPARFVLELPAGCARAHRLKPGSTIKAVFRGKEKAGAK